MDYEVLCRLDVLGLADAPQHDQGEVYREFREQLSRSETGWYEAALPWKGNHPPLPSNERGSLRRLENLEKKLKRTGLEQAYCETIEEQKAEGIVETADQPDQGVEFYIPHKPVIRKEAASTKVRAVYDASAKAHPYCCIIERVFVSWGPAAEQIVECARLVTYTFCSTCGRVKEGIFAGTDKRS